MNCLALLLVSLSTTLCAAAAPVQLHYVSHVPVQVKSQFEMQIEGTLPGMKIENKGTQTLEATLNLVADSSEIPLHVPPFKLLVTFKTLQLEGGTNGVPFEQSAVTLPLAQFKQLERRPLPLFFDNQRLDIEHNPELSAILNQLPALKNMHFKELLEEWFMPLLALAGYDLTPGAKFHLPGPPGGFTSGIDFEVLATDDEKIEAKFSGPLERAPALNIPEAYVEISGTYEGHIVFERSNALKTTSQTHYDYTASINKGEIKAQLIYHLVHDFKSY